MAKAAFRGELAFCSNFHPCEIEYEGIKYPSSEHAFISGKTLDLQEKYHISQLKTPAEAKKYGRKLKLRDDWDKVKLKVMEDVLRIKFSIPKLKRKLLDTKNLELVEFNFWHDNFYGDCTCDKCKDIVGQNNLGKLLMKIREELND